MFRLIIGLRISGAGALALFIIFGANAVVLKIPLSEMVEKSEIVVVGKIIEVTPLASKSIAPAKINHRALLEVSERIKGNPNKRVAIYLATDSSLEAPLQGGKTYVLFLRNTPNGMMIVQGYAGAILLEGASAVGIHIDGEAESQTTEKFLRKLRSVARSAR